MDNFFKTKKKTNAIVNLIAAYNTVISYKIDFNCNLLRFLLDKYVVLMIIKLVCNKNLTLTVTVSKIISGVRETVFLQNQSQLF